MSDPASAASDREAGRSLFPALPTRDNQRRIETSTQKADDINNLIVALDGTVVRQLRQAQNGPGGSAEATVRKGSSQKFSGAAATHKTVQRPAEGLFPDIRNHQPATVSSEVSTDYSKWPERSAHRKDSTDRIPSPERSSVSHPIPPDNPALSHSVPSVRGNNIPAFEDASTESRFGAAPPLTDFDLYNLQMERDAYRLNRSQTEFFPGIPTAPGGRLPVGTLPEGYEGSFQDSDGERLPKTATGFPFRLHHISIPNPAKLLLRKRRNTSEFHTFGSTEVPTEPHRLSNAASFHEEASDSESPDLVVKLSNRSNSTAVVDAAPGPYAIDEQRVTARHSSRKLPRLLGTDVSEKDAHSPASTSVDPIPMHEAEFEQGGVTYTTSGKRFVSRRLGHNNEIQRKLKSRHLQMIAFGGTLGVGLFLASGKAFRVAGPLGAFLGFTIAGLVVLAAMVSFCEMVTLIPVAGGVSALGSRFVDDAFGFSLGVVYWLMYAVGLPTELTAAAIMLSYYPELDVPSVAAAGWITLFLLVVLVINLFDVRVYGEVEYYSSLIKLIILISMIIFMVVLNQGKVGPYYHKIGMTYWSPSESADLPGIFYGPFRPTFNYMNDDDPLTGIGGPLGRFLSTWVATTVASYAYIGTEIVCVAAGEAKNPRKALPSATRRIFWRIIFFYVLGIFVVGLNFYSGDDRLLRFFEARDVVEPQGTSDATSCHSQIVIWGSFANGNQSPWIIALQSAGSCAFASVLNGFLVFFAISAGSSQLYAASRTLYSLSIQGRVPACFSWCSKVGVPYTAVLFSGSFGLLAYLAVSYSTTLIFQRLMSVCTTSGLLVWSGMCLAFIRFYHGLNKRPDIISRNSPWYPFKGPLQPLMAYVGMIGGGLLVLFAGFVVFLPGAWSVAFFFSSYGALIVFVVLFVGYKVFKRTSIKRIDQLDLDTGRREIDRIIWEEEDSRLPLSFSRLAKKIALFFA